MNITLYIGQTGKKTNFVTLLKILTLQTKISAKSMPYLKMFFAYPSGAQMGQLSDKPLACCVSHTIDDSDAEKGGKDDRPAVAVLRIVLLLVLLLLLLVLIRPAVLARRALLGDFRQIPTESP